MTPDQFTAAVRDYRHQLAASLTSSGRTLAHNQSVGGVLGSPHLYDLAADVVYDTLVPLDRCVAVAAALGLTVIREGDHDHLQPVNWVNH